MVRANGACKGRRVKQCIVTRLTSILWRLPCAISSATVKKGIDPTSINKKKGNADRPIGGLKNFHVFR